MDDATPQSMADTAPHNQQFAVDLDPWWQSLQFSPHDPIMVAPIIGDSHSSVPVCSPIINQLLSERIDNIVQTTNPPTSHGFFGPSLDHLGPLEINQQPNPSDTPQSVSHQPMDEDLIARQFAARNRPPLAEFLNEAGLENWTLLCDLLLIRFFSDSGTQLSKPFFGWREEMYVEYISHMYDMVMRRGITHFEHHIERITVEVRGGRSVEAYSSLADPHFMVALIRMLTEDFPSILTAYWGAVAVELANCILPTDKALRTDAAQMWTGRAVLKGIYAHNFFHDRSTIPTGYFMAPKFLFTIGCALMFPKRRRTFAAIFSTNISSDGILTFRLLRHSNIHTTSVIAALVLTAFEVILVKRPVPITWVPNDKKERRFREIQKVVAQEIRESLACGCDIAVVSIAEQLVRKSNVANIFQAAQVTTADLDDSDDSNN